MTISIDNFKSIGSLSNYEIQPLTILSGTNSSGKSSFIQLLLLLKQTIELDSLKFPLYLEGKLFPVQSYADILNRKASDKKIKVKLSFSKTELKKYNHYPEISIFEVFDSYDLFVSIEFYLDDNNCYVSLFEVKLIISDGTKKEHYIRTLANAGVYSIETNVAVFSNKELYEKQGLYKISNVSFSGFIPSDYEVEYTDGEGTKYKEVFRFDAIKAILKDFFTDLNYIGPERNGPQEEYRNTGNYSTVGIRGEHVAEVLEKLSPTFVKYVTLQDEDEAISFMEREDTFLDAVRYWLCEKFGLCADIYSKKVGNSYVIYVKNDSGVESTIRHVGFGISQILPIIVEGLRLSSTETLVLEQPEIHLHPKVQSGLFDFLISLVKNGKRVIVETHSDHLITRLRRRIAEASDEVLNNSLIALTFVEPVGSDLLFRNIGINDFGNLDYFPENFIEKPDVELKAILKAQMKKRINQKDK